MELGEKLHCAILAIKGRIEEKQCNEIVKDIIEKIKMHPAYSSVTYNYPVDNKGGVGYTFFQPITESFIAFDAWPDLGGAYLVICSCRDFSVVTVMEAVSNAGFDCRELQTVGVGIR